MLNIWHMSKPFIFCEVGKHFKKVDICVVFTKGFLKKDL